MAHIVVLFGLSIVVGTIVGLVASRFLHPLGAGVLGLAAFGLCLVYVSASQVGSQVDQEQGR